MTNRYFPLHFIGVFIGQHSALGFKLGNQRGIFVLVTGIEVGNVGLEVGVCCMLGSRGHGGGRDEARGEG